MNHEAPTEHTGHTERGRMNRRDCRGCRGRRSAREIGEGVEGEGGGHRELLSDEWDEGTGPVGHWCHEGRGGRARLGVSDKFRTYFLGAQGGGARKCGDGWVEASVADAGWRFKPRDGRLQGATRRAAAQSPQGD